MNRKLNILLNAGRNIKFLLKLAWDTDRKLVASYYLSAMVGAFMPIGIGITTKFLIDYLTQNQTNLSSMLGTVMFLIGLRFTLMWLEGVIYWIYNTSYLDYLLRSKIQNAVNFKFSEKMMAMDAAYFEAPKVQNLITKTRDTKTWKLPEELRIISDLTRSITMLVSAGIVLGTFGWWWPILVAIACLPRLWTQTKLGTIQWSIYGAGAPKARRLWYFEWIFSEPNVLKEVRIFQSAQYLLQKMKNIQMELYEMFKKPLDKYLVIWIGLNSWEVLFGLVLVYFQISGVTSGIMTIGGLILFIDMVLNLQQSVVSTAVDMGQALANNLYINDFRQVMELPDLVKETEKPIIIKTNKAPKIEFKNVSFSYPGTKTAVLENVDIMIEAGTNVALVGINGAGKSTIVKLLCRFYDVDEGEILINDINIKNIAKKDLYSLMGTLFQTFAQFHFSVKENIVMGNPNSDDEEKMKLAATQAGAVDFIEKFPNKYDQVLGREFDDGEEISGGQWQKLAIARAFYEQAPLLILDEPTSAIDAEAEMEIFVNLQKIYRDKTLVLVSHRFSTVRNANQIYVIDGGKVIEHGSHQELLVMDGKYAKMFNAQARGYKD